MKLSDMILKATEHDTASSGAEQILRIAKQNNTIRQSHHPHLRTAVVIAAVLCLLTATLYAAGVLSGFAEGFAVPLKSGGVQVLQSDSDNPAVEWTINEVWFDSYNLHIGGIVKTPEPLDSEKSYVISAMFRTENDDETYYLDGTAYPNGTDSVPFVMSARTVTDGSGGAFRAFLPDEKITLDLTIDAFYWMPEDFVGQLDMRDYLVCPGTWDYTLAFTRQEHRDTITLTGSFTENTDEAVIAETVKFNPFTLEIDGKNLMRSDYTRYNIWIKMKDGTYLFKARGMYLDESGNRIAYDNSTPEKLVISFWAPIDMENAEAIIIADAHGFGDQKWEDPEIETHYIEDPDALHIITDHDEPVWESWKILAEIPLK